jgi:hypothetical protein
MTQCSSHRETLSMSNVEPMSPKTICHSTKCLILYHFVLCTWCCFTNHFRRLYIYIYISLDIVALVFVLNMNEQRQREHLFEQIHELSFTCVWTCHNDFTQWKIHTTPNNISRLDRETQHTWFVKTIHMSFMSNLHKFPFYSEQTMVQYNA